jgi:hypothetical protein
LAAIEKTEEATITAPVVAFQTTSWALQAPWPTSAAQQTEIEVITPFSGMVNWLPFWLWLALPSSNTQLVKVVEVFPRVLML